MKFILTILVVLGLAGNLVGQLTAAQLEAAVNQWECEAIASVLDPEALVSEAMKFNGAICLYRNGDMEPALALFREVRRLEGQTQHLAAFWEAKCLAALGRDSLAMVRLEAIPAGTLRYHMLSQPEFDQLAQHSESFRQLKASLKPGFNIWTGTLAAIATLGLLVSLVLLFGRSRFSAGEKRLALVAFSFAIVLISYTLMWTGYHAFFPYLQGAWQFFILLVGPSLYFYLKDAFKEEYATKTIVWHYAIPALCGLFTLPGVLAHFGVNIGIPSYFFTIAASPTIINAQLLFYTLRIHGMTQNEWQVDNNIKTWTKIIAWGMTLFTGAFLSYFVLVQCSFFNPHWDYAISFVMALGILGIAYMGLLQKRIFSSEPISNFLPVKKYQTSALTEGAGKSIKQRLERLLEEDRVFKENELRLDDLAAYVNTSRHQLSQVINEHYGVNFFELINTYRVEHVKRLLADPAYGNYTIIQIAYEAGFNNKASFNRYFKQATGLTPSAYRIRETSEG